MNEDSIEAIFGFESKNVVASIFYLPFLGAAGGAGPMKALKTKNYN